MSPPPSAKQFNVPNLERGLQVLEFLVPREGEVSLNEVAKELGFPANSTMRILNALAHYGYVVRNAANKKYSLTMKLATMAQQGNHQRGLMHHSLDVMRELRDALKETVVISVLHEDAGVILEQVQGTHPFRFVCDPGIRQPVHSSASTVCNLFAAPTIASTGQA